MNTNRMKIALLGVGLLCIFAIYAGSGGGLGGSAWPSELLVLMVHETEMDVWAGSPDRQSIPTAKIVVEYLDAHCYGGRAGWRYWDNDTDASHEDPAFQEILKQVNEKYTDEDGPIIVISDGKGDGVAQPWADTPEEQVETLKKYGGP